MKRPFKTWLVDEHADADTAVGDLARDVQRDPDFPSEGNRADLLRYLEDVWGADASFLACFEEAWGLYEPAQHPFSVWLLEKYGDEADTPLGNFARDHASSFPAAGDHDELRQALRGALGDHDGCETTALAGSVLSCFDVAWREYDPTCAAPGCTHPTGEGTSLCGVHVPLEELL